MEVTTVSSKAQVQRRSTGATYRDQVELASSKVDGRRRRKSEHRQAALARLLDPEVPIQIGDRRVATPLPPSSGPRPKAQDAAQLPEDEVNRDSNEAQAGLDAAKLIGRRHSRSTSGARTLPQ